MQASRASPADQILRLAHDRVAHREWKEACDFCHDLIALLTQEENTSELAIVTDMLGRCYIRHAFESGTRPEFKERVWKAKAHYEQAKMLYEKLGSAALAKREDARAKFAEFWLHEDSDNRREIVEGCLGLSSEAVLLFGHENEVESIAQTHKDILVYAAEALRLAKDWKSAIAHFETAVGVGKKAIEEFKALGKDEDVIEVVHQTLWFLAVKAESLLEPARFQALKEEVAHLEVDLREASERAGTEYALCLWNEASGDIAFDLEADYEKALAHYRKASTLGEKLGDSMLLARLDGSIAILQRFRALGEEYAQNRREILEEAMRLAERAARSLEISHHTTLLLDAHATLAACYTDVATLTEIETEKKRNLLKKAVEVSSKCLAYEKETWGWEAVGHAFSKATYFLAVFETNNDRKAELLRQALPTRQETVRVTDILLPHSWNRGAMRNYLALIKSELASTKSDPLMKMELLRGAVSDMQQCVRLCSDWATSPGLVKSLAQYEEWFGDILVQLQNLNKSPDTAELAVTAYHDAIGHLTNANQSAPVGAINWKIAKVHDSLDRYAEASKAFEQAAKAYRQAAEKIPSISLTFYDLASYMDAWAKIERARLNHAQEEYDLSHENYAKAAALLREGKTWSGLAMLLDARSLLEKGEALSHEENHLGAIESLRTALDRFRRARQAFQDMVRKAADLPERGEVDSWTRIAEQREAYAQARVELEEARSLDKVGEKVASSRKYNSASVGFRTLAKQITGTQDRAEMETIAQFCESWAQRKEAESKSSPELFAEAAESFLKAKEIATNPGLRLLAMGDASICRALESGTRFRQSRDVQLYSEIKRHLEVASDHFIEAGFKKTGTWTRATQRLFDALMLLASAEVEREVGKKTELYHVAEQHLVLAAKLYGEAGFPSRKRETLEQLERTREEKEVLLAPLEALAEIPTASATHLPSITLRGAQPLGLERFEDAKVTGELRTPQTHLTTGSDFTVNIDIANVGKTPATLIKLEGIVPEGCEPVKTQSAPNFEGNSLDLKGKRLEYLKTHGVQVSFRPTRKGEFELSPRVVYVDEKGNYKSTNLQPLYLIVREPGVSEGLHAPPSVHLPQDFQFETERSRQVFSRLVKEFLDDYMTKRIVMERAGWRSLMDVIRDVKIPRSALYGPGGRTGPVLAELERRGLVETRVFPKERGRGGEIKKVRVAYENTIVRRIVDRAVMENA